MDVVPEVLSRAHLWYGVSAVWYCTYQQGAEQHVNIQVSGGPVEVAQQTLIIKWSFKVNRDEKKDW